MSRRYLLGAALLLIALAALLAFTPAGPKLRTLTDRSDRKPGDQSGPPDTAGPATPSKSNRRPPHPKTHIDDSGREYIRAKFDRIIIPRIDFEDTTLEEAINFLRQRSRELDPDSPDPAKKGVSFVIRKPRIEENIHAVDAELDAEEAPGDLDPGAIRIVSWQAENVSLTEALDEITRRAGLRWKIDDFAITLFPRQSSTPGPPHPKAPKPAPDAPFTPDPSAPSSSTRPDSSPSR